MGGDFYDVFRLAPNDWAVVVGDVCGKGARAASLTALARWTIRAAAVHSFMPSAVLAHLNHGAADRQPRGRRRPLLLRRVRPHGARHLRRVGHLAGAGHPRPVVVRRAGWIDVRGHVGLPLGMFDEAVPRDDRVGLGPGDALVIFTDGITEARGPRWPAFRRGVSVRHPPRLLGPRHLSRGGTIRATTCPERAISTSSVSPDSTAATSRDRFVLASCMFTRTPRA